MLSMKKLRFLSCPRAKVRWQGHQVLLDHSPGGLALIFHWTTGPWGFYWTRDGKCLFPDFFRGRTNYVDHWQFKDLKKLKSAIFQCCTVHHWRTLVPPELDKIIFQETENCELISSLTLLSIELVRTFLTLRQLPKWHFCLGFKEYVEDFFSQGEKRPEVFDTISKSR